jgi:hypothetical protein
LSIAAHSSRPFTLTAQAHVVSLLSCGSTPRKFYPLPT